MNLFDNRSSMPPIPQDSRSLAGAGTGIRWIVFDAVGTLMTPSPSVAEIYRRIAIQYGLRRNELEIGQRFRAAYHEAECSHASSHLSSEDIERRKWSKIVATVLDDASDPQGCFEALFDEFAKPSVWQIYSEVEGTLQQLNQAGYCLGVASNFDSRLHAIFDAKRELSLIQRRAVSSEVGYRKPSADFYVALLDELDSVPAEVLMVGDDLANDVTGAREVGLHAVHLQRENETAPGAISTLSELTSLCGAGE